jgi:hypothetical protein
MIEKIRKFLKDGEYDIYFAWTGKNTFADLHHEPPTIRINMFLQICELFLHEWLHIEYPRLNEKAIVKLTRKRLNRLTKKEILEITRKVCNIAWLQRK